MAVPGGAVSGGAVSGGAVSPWVRVVVVAFNAGPTLQRCIESIVRQSDPGFEAVIVDNASSDGAVDELVLPDRRFALISAGANLGFAAGSNLGARGARTPWLAMLNPDAFAEPDWLARAREGVARHPDVPMFGSTLLDAADRSVYDGCGDNYSFVGFPWRGDKGWPVAPGAGESEGGDAEVFSPCAAAAFYRRREFEQCGGFDARFFCYCEDVDLGFRLRLLGARCMQLAQSRALHVGSGTSSRYPGFADYYSARNRVWLMVKNLPAPLLLPLLPFHVLVTLYAVLSRAGQPRMWPLVRGLAASLRGLGPILRTRRQVQATRRASVREISSAICWSLSTMRARRTYRLGPRVDSLSGTQGA